MTLPTGTVTFLFTDIEGSSQLWENHPDEMRVALARHDEIVRRAIELRDGKVFKTVGDAFYGAFHTAEDAARAAIDAQLGLSAEPWPPTTPIRVRIAVHTGAAELRDNDYSPSTKRRRRPWPASSASSLRVDAASPAYSSVLNFDRDAREPASPRL
jgi:class 3 adenylate cyclase